MSTAKNKETDDVNVRLLITNRQVGSIIGKKGERIQQVRDQCGVFLSILKPETRGVQERVLALRGTIPDLSKAIELISDLILQGTSSKDKKSNADTLAICFLVQKFIVGSIIGKAGSMIQGIQSDTDTKVQISPDPLPNSTEKTVTLTGTPAGIQQATARILTQLKSFPLRAGTRAIRYKPGMRGMYDQQPQFGTSPFMAPQQQPFYGMPSVYGTGAPNQINSTQKIAIPTVCAGSIIGRGGSVIRDLRARTGCSISIQDADNDSPNERICVLTGTAHGIQHAIFQIRQLVEQYRPPYQPPEY